MKWSVGGAAAAAVVDDDDDYELELRCGRMRSCGIGVQGAAGNTNLSKNTTSKTINFYPFLGAKSWVTIRVFSTVSIRTVQKFLIGVNENPVDDSLKN